MSFDKTHKSLGLAVEFGFSAISAADVKDRSMELLHQNHNTMSVSNDFKVAPGLGL